MAGDWIPWSKGLTHKLEVQRIAARTCRSRLEVAALLMEFWEWADDQTVDGSLPGMTLEMLSASHAHTDGAFWSAVVEVGWLRQEKDDLLVIPNAGRWLGRTAKRRLKEGERKRQERHNRHHPAAKARSGADKLSACDAEKKRTRGKERKEFTEGSIEPSVAAPAEHSNNSPHPANPLWDTVCEVFGLKPVTKSERSRVGKVVRDLKAKGATPEEVRVRLGRYRRAWPNAADTPEALVKHWDRFAQEASPAAQAEEAERLERLQREREADRRRRHAGLNGSISTAELFGERS